MPLALTAHFDDSPPVRTARTLASCHSARARNPSTATQRVNRPRLFPARDCSAPDWSADLGLADHATCRAIQASGGGPPAPGPHLMDTCSRARHGPANTASCD